MQTKMQQIQAGWAILGSEGEKVGDVSDVGPNYVLVTKGLLFLKDLYIPFDQLTTVDPDRQCAYLDVAKDAVESMGWDRIPGEGESITTGYAGAEPSTTSRTDYAESDRADTYRVPVHEEERQAEKSARTSGEVRVGKNVVEERRDLDVPVTREQVDVRTRAGDEPFDPNSR